MADQTVLLSPDVAKEAQAIDEAGFTSLEKQVQAEFTLADAFMKPKRDRNLTRLKLYNNQRRDEDAAGDTTLFTIFQTVLASLYVDRLSTEWNGREEGDEETAENLNALSKFDYDEMGKDETDFEWDWDSCFFGRGLCMLSEFIRDPKNNIFIPAPEIWDPMVFVRDPRATSVNGNRLLGRNGARFFGREVRMGRIDMEGNPNFLAGIDFTKLKFGTGTGSLLDKAAQARADAQNNQNQDKLTNESKLGDNAEYPLTDWFTYWKGKRVRVWLANERKTVVGYKVLPKGDWELIDRPLYPTAHDWDGTSIPDLIEDKQRVRAIAQNLGIKAMTADLYPMYIYDQNKIKNRHDLDFGFNKMVPSDGPAGDQTITPLRKAMPNLGLLDFIYQSLDVSAQKATATPDIQQGVQGQQNRTLGELNLIAAKTETRYGLSAKVFGWSEKRFWLQYYRLYKENFADKIDEKVLRVVGAFGAKWRPILRKDIITPRLDPDVQIESIVMSRAKQLEERQGLGQLFAVIMQDPTSNHRYGEKKLAKLFGLSRDEIERLLPPTIDEMIAEDENDDINANKFVQVRAEDEHNVHIEIHSKASDTRSKYAHISAHKKALVLMKQKPELFPQQGLQTSFQGAGSTALPTPAAGGGAGQRPNPFAAKPVQPSQTSGQPGTAPTPGA